MRAAGTPARRRHEKDVLDALSEVMDSALHLDAVMLKATRDGATQHEIAQRARMSVGVVNRRIREAEARS